MKRFFNLLVLVILFTLTGKAQQITYPSYFDAAHFLWNPAMTAPYGYLEGGVIYRQQWMAFQQAPSTATATFQVPFPDMNMSLGIGLTHDELVAIKQNGITLSYAYHLPVGYGQLSIGLGAALNQFRYDFKEIVANDPVDQLILDDRTNKLSPNAMAGVFFMSNADYEDDPYFFAGIGASQLLPLDLLFESQGDMINLERVMHANATLGYRFVQDYWYIKPAIWANYSEPNLINARFQVDLEYYERFFGSIGYSTDSAISLMAGMILRGDWLSDGLLYIGGRANLSIGAIGQYKGLGYEVVVSYRFFR